MSVDEHWEDPELPIEKRYDILSSALWAQQEAYKDLAQAWKAQEERLSLIRPLYEGLYKKRWLRWLYLPLDAELEGETLLRCSTCNQLFMKDGPREFVAHPILTLTPSHQLPSSAGLY